MDISLYDFITLFVIVPILLIKFTYIPKWLFTKARAANTTILLLVLAVCLTALAAFVATKLSEGFSVRFVALAIAVLAAVAHYLYTEDKPEE